VEPYFHYLNMPSWSGAQLKKHRDNFAFYLTPSDKIYRSPTVPESIQLWEKKHAA
jgi:hypothetical protein